MATGGALSASVLFKTSGESLGDTIPHELDGIPQFELYPVRKDCVEVMKGECRESFMEFVRIYINFCCFYKEKFHLSFV